MVPQLPCRDASSCNRGPVRCVAIVFVCFRCAFQIVNVLIYPVVRRRGEQLCFFGCERRLLLRLLFGIVVWGLASFGWSSFSKARRCAVVSLVSVSLSSSSCRARRWRGGDLGFEATVQKF